MRESRYGAGSPLQFPDRNIHLKIGDMTQQRITLFPKNKVQARRDDKISCSLSAVTGREVNTWNRYDITFEKQKNRKQEQRRIR